MASVSRTMKAVKVTMPDKSVRYMTPSCAAAIKSVIPEAAFENVTGRFRLSEDEFLSVATLE